MAGYSQTPLARKLGIKDGFRIKLVNEPEYYLDLFTDLPRNIMFSADKKIKKNFIHFFAKHATEIENNIRSLKNEIEQDGIIWVSWYKKASKIPTDITEDIVRRTALANGLVDVKVCAVDEVWSGLKLMIRKERR